MTHALTVLGPATHSPGVQHRSQVHDTDWDAFVQDLDGAGLKRYLELRQQASDKYKPGK
ncbi:hypothetical protein ACFPIJ_33075 [Dactylosporangium cerinum]|uniref:Uncharacterized protein n=1 Tax=Dactylosporangium cerinum TaxID=1434730 RepID=A0ABV9W4W9_9ACTN